MVLSGLAVTDVKVGAMVVASVDWDGKLLFVHEFI